MTCDRPNRLNQQCDPGSRFQIVAQSPDAVAVAHCRKQGLSGNNYGDIAVIQYNKANGAVCFYQALGTMDGNFRAPSKGTSRSDQADSPNPNAAPWLSNFQTHSIDCGGCHDNGGIIRSPYLAQLSICPGAGDFSYNSTAPLRFIGNDYQDWNTWSVKITGNVCNNCHRLGVAGHGSRLGTSQDYGLRATAVSPPAVGSERQKNPHSADSPIWMTPGQITYSAGNDAASHAIADCATKWRAGQALPAGCTVSALSSKWTGITPASAIRVLTTEVYIN
jgi:hypothetical protein